MNEPAKAGDPLNEAEQPANEAIEQLAKDAKEAEEDGKNEVAKVELNEVAEEVKNEEVEEAIKEAEAAKEAEEAKPAVVEPPKVVEVIPPFYPEILAVPDQDSMETVKILFSADPCLINKTYLDSNDNVRDEVLLQRWRDAGVLSIEEIAKNNEIESEGAFTYGEKMIDQWWKYHGQIKGGSAHGVGRMESSSGIYEGQFKFHKRDGYGRMLMKNGASCVGMRKANMRHG